MIYLIKKNPCRTSKNRFLPGMYNVEKTLYQNQFKTKALSLPLLT